MKLQENTLAISIEVTTFSAILTTHTKMHTQLLAHPLQVVQIVSHGVGEVHENIEVQRAFGWSKHLHIHQLLLSWQKGHAHLLRSDLRLLKPHVDFFHLGRGKKWR